MSEVLDYITFYNDTSKLDFYLPLDELEHATLDRFSMLNALSLNPSDEGLKGRAGIRTRADFQRDLGSHYLLRYAFCGTDENRQWLVEQERRLFVERLRGLTIGEVSTLIRRNVQYFKDYKRIEDPERDLASPRADVQDINVINFAGPKATPVPITAYFRVPFEDALYLVRSKSVFLSRGYAIVQLRDLVNIIGGKFRAVLSKAMNDTFRYYQEMRPRLTRFSEVLEFTSKKLSFADSSSPAYGAGDGRVTHIADIESLCQTSFPLCMRRLHKALVKDNHLRHFGRMQYALFLKGLGVPLEELLAFWRSKFAKYCQSETKLRPYLYGINHMYGKEGKGTDYTPYGCIKIGSFHVMAGEHHGCPFNVDQHSMDVLRAELAGDLGVTQPALDEIMDLCYTHQPQLACGRYFKFKHPDSVEFGVNHPNTYAYESRKYWADKLAEGSSSEKKQQPLNIRKTLIAVGGSGSSNSNSSSATTNNNNDTSFGFDDEELLNIPYDDDEDAESVNAASVPQQKDEDVEMK